MKPFVLKGHSRPLTQLRYNREGDLLFSCAKDKLVTLWLAEDGERVGTYEGHNGTVYTCDLTLDSTMLVTASADSSVRLWDVESGESLFVFKMNEPCRAVRLSMGERLMALSSDPFMGNPACIKIHNLAEDLSEQTDEPMQIYNASAKHRVQRIFWTDLNATLLTCHEDGFVRRWDVETGKVTEEAHIHEEAIMDLQLSTDGSHGVTASLDKTAKLIDVDTLEVMKTYQHDRPVQSASISPLFDHIVMAGGQDAADVTTTAGKAGGFESRFVHKIYEEEIGRVRGHFGTVNNVTFSPDGRSFVTGGEDGFIRLQHFDMEYFTTKFF